MKGLQKWLDRQGWKLEQSDEITGGYAAKLYRLRLRDEHGDLIDAVYKKMDPSRVTELGLYENILRHIPQVVPMQLARIEEEDEQGVLIEYGGDVLKPIFRRGSLQDKKELLRAVIQMIADLHASLESKAQQWMEQGFTTTYPYESSITWGEEALRELAYLKDQVIVDVTDHTLQEIRSIVSVFYPLYPKWTAGRVTFTHGDPHMENILIDRGALKLIDWEWACVCIPQRDLSIVLQDVLDDELHAFAWDTYVREMARRGWESETPLFRKGFLACLIDNSLMMLGWEINKYRNGYLDRSAIEKIVSTKIRWIRNGFDRLLAQK